MDQNIPGNKKPAKEFEEKKLQDEEDKDKLEGFGNSNTERSPRIVLPPLDKEGRAKARKGICEAKKKEKAEAKAKAKAEAKAKAKAKEKKEEDSEDNQEDEDSGDDKPRYNVYKPF